MRFNKCFLTRKISYKRIIYACSLVALIPITAIAQVDNQKFGKGLEYLSLSLEDLSKVKISIATGSETTLEQAPAVASVITADQIEAIGARTVEDVLESVPGLHVSLSGTNRLDSIFSIRGIHTSFNPHVLLLLNGSKIQYQVSGGRPPIFRQSVKNISRIEIIRGPGSAIYGADAYSGVINIITKSAQEIAGIETGVKLGSFDYFETWFLSSKQYENWDLSLSLDYQKTNGDKERVIDSDFQNILDNLTGTSVSSAPAPLSTQYEFFDVELQLSNKNWDIRLHNWSSKNAGNGAGGFLALDPSSFDNSDLFSSNIDYSTDTWLKNWENKIRVNYNYYQLETEFLLLPQNAIVPIGPDGNLVLPNQNLNPSLINFILFPDGLIGNPGGSNEDIKIENINLYKGFDKHQIRLAFGTQYQSVKTEETKNFGPGVITNPSTTTIVSGQLTNVTNTENVFLDDSSRRVNFLSLQDEWEVNENWRLVYGLRYDDYSDFGDTTNPRISSVWNINDQLTAKLLYGSAFRAPSFGELGFKNNPSALGNPDLKPETIDTYELAFIYRPISTFQSNLNLFSYDAKDLIEYVFTPSAGGLQANNARDQKGYGFEWEFNWKISSSWQLNGNFAWQDSEDSNSEEKIADAPGQQASIISYWQFPNQWYLSAEAHWVADRERALGDLRNKIDDYTLVNFNLQRKKLFETLNISLTVRNVFNRKVKEPSNTAVIPNDFPLEERGVWLEMNYEF
jgi:iron complex outermembrane receptor protein